MLSLGFRNIKKKFKIVVPVGIAKGLANVHEDYLDWNLHYNVKSQNILLDSNY